MSRFTQEELAVLKQYVTHPESNVFAVKGLTGIVGPAYARYSRAQGSFLETFLKEFIKDGVLDAVKAAEVIERILIAYGDDSVGELEGAHVSMEQISNLATKEVEDRRIGGSPIEQSTRYVVYDNKNEEGNWRYLRPKEVTQSAVKDEYERVMNELFETYASLVEPMQEFYQKQKPMEEAEYDVIGKGTKQKRADLKDEKDLKAFDRTYKSDIRTKTCDTIRIFLPAATLTNVGLFGNGRFYQYLLSHLYTHLLSEMGDIAAKAHSALNQVIPTFVKRAKQNEFLVKARTEMQRHADELLKDIKPASEKPVALFDSQADFYTSTLAQMLYPYGRHPLSQLHEIVAKLPAAAKERILNTYVSNRKTRRDRPDRALEAGYPLTFDIVGDFGIYRDLQRHRMLTQQRQLLHPYLGFENNDDIRKAGFQEKADAIREKMEALYKKVKSACGRHVAQYTVLMGHKMRWTMGMNLREAQHMFELRTTPQGHPTYRRVCQEMARQTLQRYPWAKEMLKFTDYGDYQWARADSEAKQRQKERELEEK
ncbi:FAD-dependent thymidylate synthase [Candidatus Azambacteria bacterium]|nr:FAD-dependent thymidylate synthase [Candidatus Azambacteria bacterium]MBI3685214.1 FAD-dependent thymidylate synthase [Candidatus Azambacteria bacterium]